MSTSLATVDDVKRKLHISATNVNYERDSWLQDELDTAAAWFNRIARQDWDANTGGIATYWDVLETDALELPQEGCSVDTVQVVLATNNIVAPIYSSTLTSDEYDIDDDGRTLRLRPITVWQVFENAWAWRQPRRYRYVQVTWEASNGAVPEPVRDGIAMLAAGQYSSSPRLASGLTSERIGDYTYQVRPTGSGSFVPGQPLGEAEGFVGEAMRLLRPYMARRIQVV